VIDFYPRVVGRVTELTKAWTYLGKNTQQDACDKPHMLVICQRTDSGKTMFARELFNFEDQRIKRLFDKLFSNHSYEHEMLREICPVYISLIMNNHRDKLDLESWVSKTIFVETLSCYFHMCKSSARDIWREAGQPKGRECAILLQSFLLKPILLHFDQIYVLEWLFPELNNPKDSKNIYDHFWEVTMPIQKAGCWIILTGNIMPLSEFGGISRILRECGATSILLSLSRRISLTSSGNPIAIKQHP
jgi:hypothetical protein